MKGEKPITSDVGSVKQAMKEADAMGGLVEMLNGIGLAYLHVMEGETGGAIAFDYAALHDRFDGLWMANNGI